MPIARLPRQPTPAPWSSTRRTGTQPTPPTLRKTAASGRSIVSATPGALQFHDELISDAGPVVRKGVDGNDGYSGFTTREILRAATCDQTELEDIIA